MVEMDAITQLQGGVSEMEGRRRTRGRRLLTVRTYLLYSEGNSSLSRYGMAWGKENLGLLPSLKIDALAL